MDRFSNRSPPNARRSGLRKTAVMTNMIRRLIAVCLLQEGPQSLPASWNLLAVIVAVDVALGYPAAAAFSPSSQAAAQVIVSTVLAAGFVYFAVDLRGHRERFVQTATALFGTDALITLAALPIVATMAPEARSQVTVADFGMLVIGLWNLVILGHILRHALSITLSAGVLIALGYTLGSVLLTGAVVS